MEFQLLGKTIEISEGRKNYMKILTHYREMASDAVAEFNKEYEDTFGLTFFSSTYGEKMLNKYTPAYFENFFMKYVKKTKKLLASFGVYSLTDQDIYEAITDDNDGMSHLYEKFSDFTVDVVDNAPDDAPDRYFVSKFKDKFERGYFNPSLRRDIMSMCDYVENYLNDNKIIEIQFVYEKEYQTARAHYENLKDSIITDEKNVEILSSIPIGLSTEEFLKEYNKRLPASIPEEDQIALAYSLIELDPRDEDYYRYIFTYLPQARFEIFDIAKYLYIDISDLVRKSVEDIFDVKRIKTEEEALNMKQELQAYLDRFGIQESPVKTKLEKILHDFDVQARTYEGVLYDTREMCAQAANDDKMVSDLCGDIDSISKAECLDLIEKITAAQYISEIKERHTKKLQSRIINVEKAELEAMLQGLDEKTEAECETLKAAITEYDAAEDTKKPYFDRIDNRIYLIWDEENFERFSKLFMETRVADAAAAKQNSDFVMQTGRTEIKGAFATAFYYLLDEEIKNAAKYAIAKEKGMFSSILNMGKKDSYQVLTLNGRVMHPAIEAEIQAQKAAKEGGLLGSLGKLKNSFGFGKPKTEEPGKQCPVCGKRLALDAKFCSECGSKTE